MNLHVAVRGLTDKSTLRDQAAQRVAAALDRFQDRIRAVTVLLEDQTGPHKHVVDQRCRIDVRLRRGGELVIDQTDSNVLASLARALDRLKAVISRKVGRIKRGVGAG